MLIYHSGVSWCNMMKLEKSRKRSTVFIVVDSFGIDGIRRKVLEFYAVRKELSTVSKLLTVIKEDINNRCLPH